MAQAVPFLIQIAIAIAISVASYYLFGRNKPKLPEAFGDLEQRRTGIVRSSNEPRRTIYGERLISGVLAYATSTVNDTLLHYVVILAGHEVEAITDIYINDELIPERSFGGDGEVTEGTFFTGGTSYVRVKKHLGADDQVADADLVSEVTEWTADHRLRGLAYVYVRLRGNSTLFPSGPNVNIRGLVKGKKVFDTRDSGTRYTANPVLCIRDAMINDLKLGLTSLGFSDAVINAQANICDERVSLTTETDAFTVEDAADDRMILGTPEEALRWKTGDGVTLSTTGTLPAGLSPGAYFHVRYDAGRFKLATSYQNALEAVVVAITDGGSGTHTIQLDDQVRYDCHGIFEQDQTPIEVIENMSTSMSGAVLWVSGLYEIYTGSATAANPTELTIADLRGPLELRAKPERRELFNRVTGTFVNPDNFWQPSDIPPVENALYVTEDGGDELDRDVELQFTTDITRAQRIGKIHLEKSRQGITVKMPCKPRALGIRVWDTVLVTIDYLGWASKKFRVLSVNFSDELGGVDLTLQEEADASYNWNLGDETKVDPAPDTNLPNPFNVGTVSDLALTSGTAELLELGEGSIISRIKVTWTAPSTPWVDRYEIQAKKSADTEWVSQAAAEHDTSTYFVQPVEDGTNYDVRVRVISTLGQHGEFATVSNHTVIGKTEAPTPPDTLTVARLGDGTRRYAWTHAVVPADVRAGGGYRIRYFLGSTSDWDAMTALHNGLLQASPYESNELAAGTYTIAIKSVDSSGIESTTAVFAEVTLGDPRLRGVLAQRLEHELGWPGTKTDCWVYGTQLLALSGLTIGDLPPTISVLPSTIENIIPRTDPILYETPEIDLGADVSFTPLVTITGVGSFTFEMKTGTSGDGGVVGAYVELVPVTGKQYVQIRITATDPASPGAALRMDTGTIVFDGETQLDEYEDVNTATETAVWFESLAPGHFLIASKSGNIANITSASIRSIQSGGVGLTWELVSKATPLTGSPTVLGAEFKIYDLLGSPTFVDSVVDVELKGPKIS